MVGKNGNADRVAIGNARAGADDVRMNIEQLKSKQATAGATDSALGLIRNQVYTGSQAELVEAAEKIAAGLYRASHADRRFDDYGSGLIGKLSKEIFQRAQAGPLARFSQLRKFFVAGYRGVAEIVTDQLEMRVY